ncbi:MAG TPA: penicillin-binding transpeptidase domain-containing protein [Gammaproteobacteria bacterium]|nr:penicillin-binding transpeptidase domain-containing protein [Gammaproteobacteria bacterium]
MKRALLFSVLLVFSSSSFAATLNIASDFNGKNGCFILYDVNTQKIIQEYNPTRCAERIAPDSTFKVPLSLMAFDDNLITQKTVFKWDGKDKGLPQWNHDQTPQTWLKNSVVWVSQSITPELGLKKIKYYLHRFNYGNQNFSGDPYKHNGLTQAWLESSLKISADEQLVFLKDFVENKLPVSKEALSNTKQNMYLETSPTGYKLYGKTGSGKNGWFIGYGEKANQKYIFVTNIAITNESNGGSDAKALTKTILTQMKLF